MENFKEVTEIREDNNLYEKRKGKVHTFFSNYGLTLLWCSLSVIFVGVMSFIFTDVTSAWFVGLTKPIFYPPAIVFPIAWTTLYVLLIISSTIYFSSNNFKTGKKNGLILFIINGVFNILWTLSFFTLHSLIFSIIVFAVLLTAAITLVIELFKQSKGAFYFFVPYVAWLLFAFVLNYVLFLMN